MTIDSALFTPFTLWVLNLLFGVTLLVALRLAPWRKFRDPEQIHVFLGTTVALLVLWHMEAKVQPGLSFHLLGVTAVTLTPIADSVLAKYELYLPVDMGSG